MTTKNVTVHEGGFIPVVKGAGLKPGDTVAIEMEVIKTKHGLVLHPKGKYTRAGLVVKRAMLW